mmetsp:Transcript_9463/g.21023  ORF Transcript_9463/g.21023 Transcript_9463/m.21023 type:complete len:690 (-) Transcript_9463:459-2528(-)
MPSGRERSLLLSRRSEVSVDSLRTAPGTWRRPSSPRSSFPDAAPSRSLPAYDRMASSPRRMISMGGSFGPSSCTSAPAVLIPPRSVILILRSMMFVRRLRSGGSDCSGLSLRSSAVRFVKRPIDDGRERRWLWDASRVSSCGHCPSSFGNSLSVLLSSSILVMSLHILISLGIARRRLLESFSSRTFLFCLITSTGIARIPKPQRSSTCDSRAILSRLMYSRIRGVPLSSTSRGGETRRFPSSESIFRFVSTSNWSWRSEMRFSATMSSVRLVHLWKISGKPVSLFPRTASDWRSWRSASAAGTSSMTLSLMESSWRRVRYRTMGGNASNRFLSRHSATSLVSERTDGGRVAKRLFWSQRRLMSESEPISGERDASWLSESESSVTFVIPRYSTGRDVRSRKDSSRILVLRARCTRSRYESTSAVPRMTTSLGGVLRSLLSRCSALSSRSVANSAGIVDSWLSMSDISVRLVSVAISTGRYLMLLSASESETSPVSSAISGPRVPMTFPVSERDVRYLRRAISRGKFQSPMHERSRMRECRDCETLRRYSMTAVVPFMTTSLGGVWSLESSTLMMRRSSRFPISSGRFVITFPTRDSIVRFVRNPISGGRSERLLSSRASMLSDVSPPIAAGILSSLLCPRCSSRSWPRLPIVAGICERLFPDRRSTRSSVSFPTLGITEVSWLFSMER